MKKEILFYCLKVWLTSVLAGPTLFFLWTSPQSSSVFNFIEFIGFSIFFGLLLSLPSALLFWGGVTFIHSRSWVIQTQKTILGAWVAILAIIPFIFIFEKDDPSTQASTIKMTFCYLSKILAGLYGYKFPQKIDIK